MQSFIFEEIVIKHRLFLALSTVFFAGSACLPPKAPIDQPQTEKKPWFGLLHAHTRFSDGSGTPEEVFASAKSKGNHFFAVTPHNHSAAESGAKERKDGLLIATNHDLYNGEDSFIIEFDSGDELETVSVVRAANEATSSDFVAIYGQEFSTISSSNHVNVFGIDEVLTDANGDFVSLISTLKEYSETHDLKPVLQMNHPNVQSDLFYKGSKSSTKKKMFNDYGFDDYNQDFSELIQNTDEFISLIEILSGPAMAESRRSDHHYHSHENDYYFYLIQGFHISPSVGHDNHYPTWGDTTDARMGILALEITQESIFDAMRNNHTFATEDKNLDVRLSLNGSLMGSTVVLEEGTELDLTVSISDEDEPNSQYEIVLVYGDVKPQTRSTLQKWLASDGEIEELTRTGNGTVVFEDYEASGHPEFFYARIIQDNKDRAWTAPIWINHPRISSTVWVWSAKSKAKVYHHSWCRVVNNISSSNRRTGATHPSGWKQHNCTRPSSDVGH